MRLTVRGVVQGVGFRAAARRRALELNLVGWVRNKGDGSVEALAVGPADAVSRFREWCRAGPPAAKVSSLDARQLSPETVAAEKGFQIIH